MAVAMTLQQYLANLHVTYDTLTHAQAPSASRTAQASHVTGDRLAKAVVLKTADGYLTAVVPASHRLELDELGQWLEEPVYLATEKEIEDLFPDCETGAIPALANAYGLSMLVDESLDRQPEIYFEAGDHCTLVHMTGEQFHRLMEGAPHGRFSIHG